MSHSVLHLLKNLLLRVLLLSSQLGLFLLLSSVDFLVLFVCLEFQFAFSYCILRSNRGVFYLASWNCEGLVIFLTFHAYVVITRAKSRLRLYDIVYLRLQDGSIYLHSLELIQIDVRLGNLPCVLHFGGIVAAYAV